MTQENRGQSVAINRGVVESRGRFIKIVDADDWLNPRHLESQLSTLSDSEQAVSACRWGYFAEQADSPHVKTESTDHHYDDPLEWIVDSLSRDEGMMGGWRWLIPRTVWDRAGGYDERLSLNNDFHASIANPARLLRRSICPGCGVQLPQGAGREFERFSIEEGHGVSIAHDGTRL